MKYKNRTDAGLKLAFELRRFAKDDCIVCAIPRGGVPVAFEVAASLHFPMQLVLAKKIGHPVNKEYAIGAASLNGYFVWADEEVSDTYIAKEVERIQTSLREMEHRFGADHKQFDLKQKTLLVIDDGVATGNTILASIQLLRKKDPLKIIVAVPVASSHAYRLLQKEADEVVCLYIAEQLNAVGSFYEDFSQVTNEEVTACLDEMEKTYQHSPQPEKTG